MVKKKIKINLAAESVDKNTANIAISGKVFNDGKNTANIRIKTKKK